LGAFLVSHFAGATYGDTTTFLGAPYDGDGGLATNALLDFPEDVTADGSGNLYIADTQNHAIRKVDAAGIITTLAGGSYGSADGQGAAAEFAQPRGVAVDAAGVVYVADSSNNAIRTISPTGSVTTLVASGLSSPQGVAVAGATLFVADTGNNALKGVSTSGGTVATIASNLSEPKKIAALADGSVVFVADNGSHRVLKVVVATGAVSVVAGSGRDEYEEGTGESASFQNVYGVALDRTEENLFVSDHDLYLTDRIRSINLATGATSLLAVDTAQQEMIFPAGMVTQGNQLYVAMSGLGIVRKFHTRDATITSIVAGGDRFGTREGANPLFGRPSDLFLTEDLKTMYLADNNRIRRIDMATKTSSYVIGSIVDNYRDGVPETETTNNLDEARFSGVAGIAVNSASTAIYVADRWNNRIRKVDLTVSPYRTSLVTGAGRKNSTGETSNGYQEGARCDQVVDRTETLALQAGCAYFLQPTSLVLDPSETHLYVADSGNNRIRKVRLSDGATTLVAGGDEGSADGVGAAAQFKTPWGITLSDDGKTLYVADRDNHRIRAINLETNAVTTVAGSGSAGYREGIGTAAFFSFPRSVKLGADGKLYLTESGSQRIRQLDPATGLTKLVSGSGNRGYPNGAAASAEFNGLTGIAPETGSNVVYVADSSNDVIRQIDITGVAPYTNPAPTVTAVRPAEVDPDWDKGNGLRIKITGTGFRYGAVARFFTYRAIKTYVVSSKEIVAQLPLSKMKPGWYDITVTNVDGQFGFLEAGIAIRAGDDSVPDVFYSERDIRGITAYPKSMREGFFVAAGNVWGDERDEIIVGTGNGLRPQVRIFSNTGFLRGKFDAFPSSWRTGVRVAVCDLNGDGRNEIIATTGAGVRAKVKVFRANGKPTITGGFSILTKTFRGGANIACGDVTGDGKAEILVAAARGGTPTVYVYRSRGQLVTKFSAQAKRFRGGVTLATADLNNDGIDEILTAPESGAGYTRAYSGRGKQVFRGFFPYGASYTGGVSVAGGDTNHDGKTEIVVSPRSGQRSQVRVYTSNTNRLLAKFTAYPRAFTGGVNVAVGDANGDGTDDIITAPVSNFTASIRMFRQNGSSL
jgi:DNA-binding beta-propeller fold protein YncE